MSSSSITIQEQRHHIWKVGTYISGILAVLLTLVFWNIPDPLWVGILRLLAFIFFSLAVFGVLKCMGDPLTVTLRSTSEHLIVNYSQGDSVVQKEQFERSSIDNFLVAADSPVNWIPLFYPESKTIKISFNDGHQDLNLFEYSGRTLFFAEPNIQEALTFLESQDIGVPASSS
jgi:hypothetical protein